MHRGCEIPSLEPLKKLPLAAVNDHEVAKYDVVLSLVKMNILPRIRYNILLIPNYTLHLSM